VGKPKPLKCGKKLLWKKSNRVDGICENARAILSGQTFGANRQTQ
jgi:hypothetical protein